MKSFFQNRGFTLVETIVVVSLYTMITLLIYTSIFNLYQANGYTIAQSYEIDNARRGLQNWLRDAREMAYSVTGTFPIAVIEPQEFGFYTDIDKDEAVEYVEYVLSGTTLYKNIYEASGLPPVYNLVTPNRTEILSEYVQNIIQGTSTFLYFDGNGAALSSGSALLTDVRYIEARIIVNIDPVRSPGEFLLRSGVTPRNLKDNL